MSMADHAFDEERAFDHALRALREDEGTDEQARALEQRLLDALGPEALGATVTQASADASLAASRLWWMLGVSALIGAGLLFVRAHDAPLANDDTHSVPQVALPTKPSVPAPSPAVANALLNPQPVIEAAPQTRKPSARRSAGRTATSPQAVQAEAKQPREDELSLLQRSRRALRRDPAMALTLAEQHARDYPRGIFVQEREVLALQALLKQRRRAEAIERAERFIAEQAGSPYAVRIRDLLVQEPHGADTRRTSMREGSRARAGALKEAVAP